MMQISRPIPLVVALAVVGAIAGAAVSFALPPVYASSSWVLVQVSGTAGDASERGQRVRTAIEAALQQTAFDKKTIAVMQRGERGRDPVLLEVSASAGSAQAAQQGAAKAIGSIIEANFVGEQRERTAGVQFRVVQPADLPSTAHRDTTRNAAAGAGLGLIVGAVIAVVGRRRRVVP